MHDAFETIWCFDLSYEPSFTPITTVRSIPFPGALSSTFFAPAFRWLSHPALSVNLPVLSTTTSMFSSFQGYFAESKTERTFIFFPSIIRESSVCSTLPPYFPWTESYLKRWARVFASVMSFTAIQFMLLSFMPALRTNLPILPKPFIATFIILNHLLNLLYILPSFVYYYTNFSKDRFTIIPLFWR